MSKVVDLLGDKTSYYLDHTCKTIDKSLIYIPSPDTIDKVWIDSDRNIKVLNSLQTLLGHGRLANTGYVSILPVDQDIEHTAGASFAPNPIYFDPENIVKLAIEGGCNAVASTFGILGSVARKYAHKIPFVVKLNHNELLTKIANNVVAIENDTALVEHLRKLFSDARNVQVVGCDFRNFAVPKFPFKVVSNIPYGITSDIFKILMFESLGNFLGGSIVLQLEPTQKLFSRKLYNPYTVFYHTFFDLKLVYEVGPESFFPPPTVKSALLNIKRKQLFFDFKFKAKYLAFISCLLEKPDLSVKTALKSIFRKSQVRSISEKFGLNLNAQIVCLSPSQWVNCFLEMLEVVPEKFHPS